MRALTWILFVVLLMGCASGKPEEDRRPPGGPGRASAEELREYIDKVQPDAVFVVYYKEPLRWKAINNYFAILDTRDGPHLIELSWECEDLFNQTVYVDMADRREKRGILRAKVDTLRGCRIENFYKLPEVEGVEDIEDVQNTDENTDDGSGR
ncbi:MAG: DUF6491 family protein [Proteobacteria bacterium]|nr:DUF6491 family protein [Pseudomonadota bacterium]